MTAEVVVYADIEAVAIAWLQQNMPGVRVATRRVGSVENPGPTVLIGASEAGGFVNMVTDEVMLNVQAYAADEVTAAELCQRARAFLKALPLVDGPVFGTEFYALVGDTTVYRFPDSQANAVRYQCVVQLLIGPEYVTHTRS